MTAIKIGKLKDTGQIVQVVDIAETVEFSDQSGWILIDPDFSKGACTIHNVRWIPAQTEFIWIRDYIGA